MDTKATLQLDGDPAFTCRVRSKIYRLVVCPLMVHSRGVYRGRSGGRGWLVHSQRVQARDDARAVQDISGNAARWFDMLRQNETTRSRAGEGREAGSDLVVAPAVVDKCTHRVREF